ncbi:Glutathione S-transferase family protein [Zea mays]|uniref:Glutathione S-transferase family protein n=1 Tax=Zea mays TaxID=4577 RepID=A0A1D6FAK8_MAIZE|nr:Glutathione S-transferase family protein [Zea mays]
MSSLSKWVGCLTFIKLKGLNPVMADASSISVMFPEYAARNRSVKPIFKQTKEIDDHLGWVFPAAANEEPGAGPTLSTAPGA